LTGSSLVRDLPDVAASPPGRRAVRAQSCPPIVIAHRGASGYRPEHTLASYELAIRLGADFVEPDLVSTCDGVLVARHENEIGGTTDVARHPGFARRRCTKVVDGEEVTGWFVEDFTLAELKTLRAVERLPQVRPGNTRYDGRFEVPTFAEVLELAAREGRRRNVTIGVYPETKNPTYFASLGLSLNDALVATLLEHDLDRPNAPVFVQSYEVGNLQELSTMTRVPLVQLLDDRGGPYDLAAMGSTTSYADLATAEGLRSIAAYAAGVGPDKDLLLPRSADGSMLHPTSLVADAHAAGLFVHAYTLRDENRFLPADLRLAGGPDAKGNAFGEYERLLDLGVDGFFCDHTDTGVQARDWWQQRRAS
jgi:glycerophosphoryl diester phosphodiesterase